MTLEVSDDGNDDDNDDDGLWKPMITKLSENPTKQETEITYESSRIVSCKTKKLGGIIKTRYENGNQEKRLYKRIFKCVLVSYDLDFVKNERE